MSKTGKLIFNTSLIIILNIAAFSCGRNNNPVIKPSVLPSGQPVESPVASSTNKPPNADPPDDGTGGLPNPIQTTNPKPTPTNPPPPDPQQPQNDTDFWNLMKRFGFTKTKEEITADIKKQISLKISDWSAGNVNDKTKNIEAKFKESAKYFKPALKDSKEYLDKSLLLANKKDGIDFYLDVTFGPKGGTVYVQKIDAKTLEVLFINRNGLISNYTKTDGALLRLAHFMRISPTVYK